MPGPSSRRAPVPISSRRCEACGSSSPGRSPTASAPRRPCARAATPSCWRRCCAPSRSRSRCRTNGSAPSCSPAPMRRAPSPIIRAARSSRRCRRSPSAAAPPRPRAPWAFARCTPPTATRAISSLCCAPISCARSPIRTARRCSISPARTAPAISPKVISRKPACPCAPWWSIAPSRPRVFRLRSRPRLAQGAIDGVLHFSARSAEAYLDCAAQGGIARSGARTDALLSLPPGGGAARRRRRGRGADRGPAGRDGDAGAGGGEVSRKRVSRATGARPLGRADGDPGPSVRLREAQYCKAPARSPWVPDLRSRARSLVRDTQSPRVAVSLAAATSRVPLARHPRYRKRRE